MQRHKLKTWPRFFEAVRRGEKTFELRKEDRNFVVGDMLILQEWHPQRGDTGRHLCVIVTYILSGTPPFSDAPDLTGWVILGIRVADNKMERRSK